MKFSMQELTGQGKDLAENIGRRIQDGFLAVRKRLAHLDAARRLGDCFQAVRKRIGILGILAAAAVPAKLWLFYALMGTGSNFFAVWLTSCLLILLLFTGVKHKWAAALIYLALSVLMFADAAYSSFFNRYLSLNMLGAAGFLGDVTDSIKEVLQPKFFLLFADAILVLLAAAFQSVYRTFPSKRSGNE